MAIDLIDHRYFYAGGPNESIGMYTCGMAREAAARQLRRYGVEKFGQTDFLTALTLHSAQADSSASCRTS
jgi:hypothetical protein